MADSDMPKSPFAGLVDVAAQRAIRVLSSEDIERMLALHRRYRKTEYHEGHRADLSSVDLIGQDFFGLEAKRESKSSFEN